MGLPWWLTVKKKNPPVHVGDLGSIPGSGRSSGERNDNPLQCSCLGNPMDRGACRATVHGVRVGHDLATKQQHSWNDHLAPSNIAHL